MNVYELIFNEDNPLGVYGASLVDEPANEVQAVFLSKDVKLDSAKLKIKLASEEKRVVVSPLLIPNKKIYRNNAYKGNAGYVFFSENTIEKLQQNFFKRNFNHNSTIGHQDKIEDVYIFESWLVEDTEKDKSNFYGFSVPKGTWMVAMKIENDNVWENFIKTKEVTGLSIDAILEPILVEQEQKILFKKSMKVETINEIVNKAIQEVALASELKEFKDKDGKSIYASELSSGYIVTDKDGNPMKDSSFEVDGIMYKTDDMGALVPVEVVTEDVVEDEVEETMEDVVEDVVEVKDEVEVEDTPSELEAENADLKAKNLELEAKVISLEEMISAINEELVLMKKETPSSEGIMNIELNKEEKPKGKLSPMEALRSVINQ